MAFGRFERRAAPTPMSEINMTPLIDVMLVLLVIFMLAAPLLAQRLRLELPSAPATQAADAAAPTLAVALDAQGQLYLREQAVTLPQLQQALAAQAQQAPQTEVQLRADRAVPYGQVAKLIGVVQQAGLARIGFVAEPD